MSELRLGIMGLSEGNGHPYSWAAILNGYNSEYMKGCPFPVIYDYLEQQNFPEARLPGARVTHIWTQDREISEDISRASRIDHVVDNYIDMIGEVDGVLLARDDAENHLEMARPFLEAGIPVYIDKPVALSRKDLSSLFDLQKYPGQIFTCSALQFSTELILTKENRESLGEIKKIHGVTPKSWDKYAVHIIEPILRMINYNDEIIDFKKTHKKSNGVVTNICTFDSGVQLILEAYGKEVTPIKINIEASKTDMDLIFTDSFSAFKEALRFFILGVNEKRDIIERSFIEKTVELIERGRV